MKNIKFSHIYLLECFRDESRNQLNLEVLRRMSLAGVYILFSALLMDGLGEVRLYAMYKRRKGLPPVQLAAFYFDDDFW